MLVAPMEDVKDIPVRRHLRAGTRVCHSRMMGLEAGQSAFGDVFAWFKNILSWALQKLITDETQRNAANERMIALLSEEASKLPLSEKR